MSYLYLQEPLQSQPKDTWGFALNAVKGKKIAIGSESANTFIGTLPGKQVGSIRIDKDHAIIFCEPGYIVLFDGFLTILHEDEDFNFSREHPIHGQFNVVNGCERYIYWCDNYNPDRFYNLDRPDQFTSLSDFDFVPDIDYPLLSTDITTGGLLFHGSYRFVIELLDNDDNVMLRTLPSFPVSVGQGFNIDTSSASVGGEEKIDAAISLLIENIDLDFEQVRVGVLIYRSGDGLTPFAHYLGDPRVIQSSSMQILYQGYNPGTGDTPTDWQELLTPITGIVRSTTMTTVHGGLLRGGISEQGYDYSTFQQYASKIKTEFVVEQVDPEDILDRRTEQGDEVRMYGIIYLSSKGFVTPTFHLPGRAKTELDAVLTTGELIGEPDPVEQWRIQNTAQDDGTMGYYETNEIYTNPLNYEGDDFWGVDVDGNTLLGTPVRGHRIPDRSIVPLLKDEKIQLIGVKFSNIEYPHPDIVGHFIVCNNSTILDRTVMDAGYMIPYNYEADNTGDKQEGRYIHYLPGVDNEAQSNTTTQHLVSVRHLIDKVNSPGDYVHINGRAGSLYADNRPKYGRVVEDGEDNGDAPDDVQLFGKHHEGDLSWETLSEKIGLEQTYHLPSSSILFGYPNRSRSSNNQLLLLEQILASFDQQTANLHYTYIKRNARPFSQLSGIEYRMLGELHTQNTQTIFNGDSYIVELNITNISDITFPSGQVNVEYEYIHKLYTESPYNFNRRPTGTDPCNLFVGSQRELGSIPILKYESGDVLIEENLDLRTVEGVILYRIAEYTGQGVYGAWTLNGSICPEWYGYNKDMGIKTDLFAPYVLPANYDYASRCLNYYPTDIVYSEVRASEGQLDRWRINKPLNRISLPSHRGPLVRMDYYNRSIVCRMYNGAFELSPDVQTIQTDETTLYLGDARFLAIPAVEMNTTDASYGGQQSPLGSCITPFGLVWVDQIAGRVFMRSPDGTKTISNLEVHDFFVQHAKLRYSTDPLRFGAVVSFDPLLDRLIVHIRNYELIDRSPAAGGYAKEFYVDRGFNISYDMLEQHWISFHSWRPDTMFFVGQTMYSSPILGNDLYKHTQRTDLFCNFYGKDFPFIVQPHRELGVSAQHWGVHYYAQCMIYDEETETWVEDVNRTFDKGWMFTYSSSSGVFQLLLNPNEYEGSQWSTSIKSCIFNNKMYRIAGIRDLLAKQASFTKRWEAISVNYDDNQGYMDIVPANVDYARAQHLQSPIEDRYVHLRLIFNSSKHRMLYYYQSFPTFPIGS